MGSSSAIHDCQLPRLMMPAYTTALLLRLLLLVRRSGHSFLCNVVIAVVCNEYNSQVERGVRANLPQATAGAGVLAIGREGRRPLIAPAYRDGLQGVKSLRKWGSRISTPMGDLRGAAHSNRDSSISPTIFVSCAICSRCAFDASIRRPSSRVCPEFWSTHSYQVLEHIVRHRFFEYGIDLMLIINAVFLVVEDWRILMGDTTEFGCSGRSSYPILQWSTAAAAAVMAQSWPQMAAATHPKVHAGCRAWKSASLESFAVRWR